MGRLTAILVVVILAIIPLTVLAAMCLDAVLFRSVLVYLDGRAASPAGDILPLPAAMEAFLPGKTRLFPGPPAAVSLAAVRRRTLEVLA